VKPISTHLKRAHAYLWLTNQKICPISHLIAAPGTTPVPRHLPSVKNVSVPVRVTHNVPPLRRTSTARRDHSSSSKQKHFAGHFTYECKATRPYVSRPSRTAQLENPRVLAKLKADGKPSVEVPEEFKNKFRVPPPLSLKYECLTAAHALLGYIGAELRIGSWRPRRNKERRIERRNGRSGTCHIHFSSNSSFLVPSPTFFRHRPAHALRSFSQLLC